MKKRKIYAIKYVNMYLYGIRILVLLAKLLASIPDKVVTIMIHKNYVKFNI